MRLFPSFVTGSDESGWDNVAGELASLKFLVLRRSLSAQSLLFVKCDLTAFVLYEITAWTVYTGFC